VAQPVDESALFLDTVRWQFRMSWSLARDFHLSRVTDEVCAWMPHPNAFTVRRQGDGSWRGDWGEPPEGEPWAVSVSWLTWHLQLWLTQALAEVAMTEVPTPHDVQWPATAGGVVAELDQLATDWTLLLASLTPGELDRPTTFPWSNPRPLHRLVAWANMEMMKNAAELGAAVNAALLARAPADQE
jgi:hypothetical protein